jgi:hypothetical protein
MRTVEASRRAALIESYAAPVLVFVTVALLAADQGGYFPRAWGWGALLTLLPLGVWLLLGRPTEAGALDGVLIAGFAVVAAWTALSIAWSDSVTSSVYATERAVLYVSALAAVALMVRKRQLDWLIVAVWLAITLVAFYGLCTRLFPDHLGVFDPIAGYRLSEPVGYWNGLGILAAIGALLALGLAARNPSVVIRAGAAGSLAILLPTLYFTFSRGAWIALGIGLVCAFAYDAKRLQLAATMLLLLPAPALATLFAARSYALTHINVPLAEAVQDGRRLGLVLLALVPAAILCSLLGVLLERRLHVPRALRTAAGGAMLAVPLAALVLVLVHYGGPVDAVSRAYESFKSPPAEGPDLNRRLLSLTSNGRLDLWDVAWAEYVDHPVLGTGAGTYSRHWFRDRPAAFNARDAHSLYVETLAELGPVGLAALAAGLVVPLVAAVRSRRQPYAALLFGAYVAFVIHAAVDWDFELPGVSLAGLLCGLALVVAARSERRQELSGGGRGVAFVLALALTAFSLWALIGNSALAASEAARKDRDWAGAENQARKARRLMPWSPEPWEALGFAQAARGDSSAAAASFRRAIARDAGDWTLWFDLAAVAKGEDRREAIAQARRLNPLSPELRKLSSRSG